MSRLEPCLEEMLWLESFVQLEGVQLEITAQLETVIVSGSAFKSDFSENP